MGDHQRALEEMHFVVSNREGVFGKAIGKSNYFQFVIRDIN